MPKVNIGYATLPVCDNSDSYNRFCQNNGYASGSNETAYSGGSCGLWNTTIGSWVQSSSVLFNINCVVQGQQPCTPTQNQSCTYCSNKCTDIIVCPSGTSWNYTSCQKNCPVQMGTDGGYAGCQGSYANIPNSIIDPSFYCPGGGHVASCFKCNSGYTWSGTYCNLTPPVVCGDGVCSSTETCKTCSTDCGLCSHTIVPIKD